MTNESGASAVIIAASLVLLMAMAAVAIDLGAGFDERRQDQVAADGAVLAGAVSAIDQQSLEQIVLDIKANASTNLDGRTLDWATCEDPDRLTGSPSPLQISTLGLDLHPTLPCISFGPNDDGVADARVRVRIPDQAQATTFARVIGSAFLSTSAEAEAVLNGDDLYRNFPAMVYNTADPGEEFCVRSSPGNPNSPTPAEDCEGSASGNFGLFLPYFYTNVGGWQCDTGGSSVHQGAYAIANGIDHFLASNPTVDPAERRENGAECPQDAGPLNPNQIRFTSGNDPNITRGLVTGDSGGGPASPASYNGRLTNNVWGNTYGTATVFGFDLDNRPLYTYIDATGGTGKTACDDAANGPTSISNAAEQALYETAMQYLADCLSNSGGTPPTDLFDSATGGTDPYDLYRSPRLTTVPLLNASGPCGNNSCLYDIIDFVPIFLNSLYTNDLGTCENTTDATGGMVRDPGIFCRYDPGSVGAINDNAPGQRTIKSATAIVLTCDVLPPPGDGEEKCKRIGSGSASKTTFISSRLTK